MVILILILLVATAVLLSNQPELMAQETAQQRWAAMQNLFIADQQLTQDLSADEPVDDFTPCQGGKAENYPCAFVDLLSQVTIADMDAERGNDIWGWTDQTSGKEFALVGLNNGLAFVDVSDPTNPLYLGKLPPHTVNSTWRDVKVYRDHAFVVSEASDHGLQIFALKELLNVATPPVTFAETKHYDQFGRAHNIAINEESGYAYVVGAAGSCSSGLHMIDIQDPINPQFAGCFSQDGYTHDAQCVLYQGPDTRYQGSEVCFNANEDTLTIADVTDKNNPSQLARQGYPGVAYAHQGWLTEDQAYFLLGDEGDEGTNLHNTRTYIWDVSDLHKPQLIGTYTAPLPAIDHNLYIYNGLVYEANYRSGLRILDAALIPQGKLTEVAYFDTYPPNNATNFNGAWSVYPFFISGSIIVSDIERGLFVLKYVPPKLHYLPIIQ